MKKRTNEFEKAIQRPATNHVTLGFNYGVELHDPIGILEGTGKLFTHVKIKSVKQLFDKELIKLLKFSTIHRIPKIEDIYKTTNNLYDFSVK